MFTSKPTDCTAAARSCSRSASSSSSSVGVCADARTSMTSGRRRRGGGGGGGSLIDLRRRPKRSASVATPKILPRLRRWPPAVGVKEESAVAGRESVVPRANLCLNGIVSSSARELAEKTFRANQYRCAGAPWRLQRVAVAGRRKRTIGWRLDRVKNTMLLSL
jgi:hypothetical protein